MLKHDQYTELIEFSKIMSGIFTILDASTLINAKCIRGLLTISGAKIIGVTVFPCRYL